MMKQEYFFNDEEKELALSEEQAEMIAINEFAPFVPFDLDAMVFIERRQLLTTPEFYFECQFEEEDKSTKGAKKLKASTPKTTVIVSDGMDYLPPKIAQLVLQNDWFCVCVRQIEQTKPHHESISLMIFYDDVARLHFSDEMYPGGVASRIFVNCSENPDDCYYAVYYNGHPLALGDNETFECEAHASVMRLSAIDFVDKRGINYLAQCLRYRTSLHEEALDDRFR